MRTAAVVLAVFAALAARPADACLHAAGAAPTAEPISQRGQQAIILHDGATEDLILRVEYEGVDAPSLAWIVPVPAMPTAYEAMDGKLFDDVGDWVQLARVAPPVMRAASADGGDEKAAPATPSLLQLGPPAKVGPFAIQPIKVDQAADRKAGGEALNAWMREHGFAEISAEGLSYYVDRGWTFVAVRIEPEGGGDKVAAEGGLPPLRLTFPSTSAVYPLKLSTHMGELTARVYLVTTAPPSDAAIADLPSKGFEAVVGGEYKAAPRRAATGLETAVSTFAVGDAPPSLRPLLTARFAEAGQLHMSVLLSELVNAEAPELWADAKGSFRPVDWTEDLAVPPLAPPAVADKAAETAAALKAAGIDPDTKIGPVLPAKNMAAPDADAAPADGAANKPTTPTTTTAPRSGCGCRAGEDTAPSPALPWLVAVGLMGRGRRRRRR